MLPLRKGEKSKLDKKEKKPWSLKKEKEEKSKPPNRVKDKGRMRDQEGDGVVMNRDKRRKEKQRKTESQKRFRIKNRYGKSDEGKGSFHPGGKSVHTKGTRRKTSSPGGMRWCKSFL